MSNRKSIFGTSASGKSRFIEGRIAAFADVLLRRTTVAEPTPMSAALQRFVETHEANKLIYPDLSITDSIFIFNPFKMP